MGVKIVFKEATAPGPMPVAKIPPGTIFTGRIGDYVGPWLRLGQFAETAVATLNGATSFRYDVKLSVLDYQPQDVEIFILGPERGGK